MAIQWGSLTPIAGPQVVGSLPTIPNNQVDTLAGGLMQGLSQADAMKTNALSRAAMQQQMQQQAGLYPGQLQAQQQQLQQGQQTIEQNQLALDKSKQEKIDFDARRTAAAQGMQQYQSYLEKTDPVAAVAFQSAQEKLIQDRGLTKANIEKMHTEQLQNTMVESEMMAVAASQVSGIQNPQQKQAAWEIQKVRFKRAGIPNDQYPDKFSDQWGAAMMGIQTINQLNVAQLEAAKRPVQLTELQKNQSARNTLQEKADNGTITKIEQKQLDELNVAISKDTSKGLVSDVLDKTADFLGFGKKSTVNTPQSTTKQYTRDGKPFDMEAAKKATGLSEEEIIKQAGLK